MVCCFANKKGKEKTEVPSQKGTLKSTEKCNVEMELVE